MASGERKRARDSPCEYTEPFTWSIPEGVSLSHEQRRALTLILDGRNVVLLGKAGTGKSFVFGLAYKAVKAKHEHNYEMEQARMAEAGPRKRRPSKHQSSGPMVEMTALTGTAASTVNGRTLHSCLGLGLGDKSRHQYQRINKKKRAALASLRTLFIDEVFMATPRLMRAAHVVLVAATGCQLPFGGVQIVASGDPLQLPPVSAPSAAPGSTPTMLFDAPDVWYHMAENVVLLRKAFRHADAKFDEFLEHARVGKVTHALLERLNARVNQPLLGVPRTIKPTSLYCYRSDVDAMNQEQLRSLPAESEHVYAAHMYTREVADGESDHLSVSSIPAYALEDDEWVDAVEELRGSGVVLGHIDRSVRTAAKPHSMKQTMARMPPVLSLRVGAQVMCTINRPDFGLVNGSRGVVLGFCTDQEYVDHVMVTTRDEAKDAEDGESKDAEDDEDAEDGESKDAEDDEDDEDDEAKDAEGAEEDKAKCVQRYPMVRFNVNTETGPRLLDAMVPPYECRNRVTDKLVLVYQQVPLVLAWAMTAHKAQSATIDALRLCVDRTFACGQAYTAVSRGVSFNRITLTRPMTVDSFAADPAAVRFWMRVMRGEDTRPGKEYMSAMIVDTSEDLRGGQPCTNMYSFLSPRAHAGSGAQKPRTSRPKGGDGGGGGGGGGGAE